MNKTEFVNRVAEKTGITKKDAKLIVDSVFSTVADVLTTGDSVNMTPFGKFETVTRAARTGRNPQTGGELQIPQKQAVKFKPSGGLKDLVNQ